MNVPCLAVALIAIGLNLSAQSQPPLEKLDRGLVVMHPTATTAAISWRLLGTDVATTAFNVYRKAGNNQPVLLNKQPLTTTTHFTDSFADLRIANTYTIIPVVSGKGKPTGASYTLPAHAPVRSYLSVPLQVPPTGTTPDGLPYTYSANDASVGDLDGDGRYELILKWQPSNAKNPPQTGFTGNQLLDAYTLEGRLLWRIDLGKNIRSGAAYTQFLVYDFDGDGRAELACKTADGTIDGKGKAIGDAQKDWRTYTKGATYGKILDGPEFMTVFDGLTGAALATDTFIPNRYPLDGWGGIGGNGGNDNTGSRPDHFTAGVAYLDGVHPSIVSVRGWYGRSVVAAWDWRKGKLSSRWVFDSKDGKNPYSGMGNHSLSIADVDKDGKDEVCIGAMTVDDNGNGLYTTGLRHGDALHLTVMHPDSSTAFVFGIHENEERTVALQTPGVALYNAANGNILWSLGPGVDVGRGVAADIDPTHVGFENWGGPGGLRDVYGKTITTTLPSSTNFVIWWDGDLTRELLDQNRIDKWNWQTAQTNNLLTAVGCAANNGTKANPALTADLLGDWREEAVWRTEDSKELRIYTTPVPTPHRFITLMHDRQYRLAIAWQNSSYNQPPHPGFYLGAGMKSAPIKVDSSVARKALTAKGKLLYSSNFTQPLTKEWVAEIEPQQPASVATENGNLVLDTKGGVTVWLNKKLNGDVRIEYDREVIVKGGANDRLSDLNQFWMAIDPRNPNLFTRSGKLESYDSLSLYYIGMGGNTNTTTRFRKYNGQGERTLLQEYTDSAHLLQPNTTYHITIIVKDNETSYWINGQCYFLHKDTSLLKSGYFGFRSTKSRQFIRNLKIIQL